MDAEALCVDEVGWRWVRGGWRGGGKEESVRDMGKERQTILKLNLRQMSCELGNVASVSQLLI